MNQNQIDQIDLLHRAEKIAQVANEQMNKRGRGAFSRYPMLFTFFVVFGIIAIDEGVKGILDYFGFADHPVYLLLVGIIILVMTGTLFKKLDEFHIEK